MESSERNRAEAGVSGVSVVSGRPEASTSARTSPGAGVTPEIPSIEFLQHAMLGSDAPSTKRHVAVIVCNWSLPSITRELLMHASYVIAADGGANRLYDELPTLFPDEAPDDARKGHLPHCVAGDLDSIRDDVRAFYEGLGVRIHDLSHDQDSTDLMKCLDLTVAFQREQGFFFSHIFAVGTQGGRLDHILGNLSILHMYRDLPLLLLGDGNLTRLVPRGASNVCTSGFEGPKCGLIPVCGTAVASTRGLRWNLNKTTMAMGGLVSSCNEVVTTDVYIETDVDLVWTTELHDHQQQQHEQHHEHCES